MTCSYFRDPYGHEDANHVQLGAANGGADEQQLTWQEPPVRNPGAPGSVPLALNYYNFTLPPTMITWSWLVQADRFYGEARLVSPSGHVVFDHQRSPGSDVVSPNEPRNLESGPYSLQVKGETEYFFLVMSTTIQNVTFTSNGLTIPRGDLPPLPF